MVKSMLNTSKEKDMKDELAAKFNQKQNLRMLLMNIGSWSMVNAITGKKKGKNRILEVKEHKETTDYKTNINISSNFLEKYQ